MSFLDQRRANYQSATTFGNPDHFGIPMEFIAIDGSGQRTVVMRVIPNEPGDPKDEWEKRHEERMWVECAQDPACARGGIATPQQGDQVLYPGDAPGAVYVYADQKRNVTAYSWQLLFVRQWVRGHGPKKA